ncbi:MAG: DNA topology modulation protein FlaR, partial [Clostridium sp.]
MKIAIIGNSGSGKSTLARILGDHYKIPVLFLDTVQFVTNWKVRDKDEGRDIVLEFMKNTSWVIDGNYTGFYQRERLEEADKIIFMNFPRRVCLYRAIKRYFMYKGKTRESMTEGCNEKIDFEFVWWILHEGRNREKMKHYRDLMQE